jgi:hypothetical protein
VVLLSRPAAITDHRDRADMSDHRDRAESTDPRENADPTEKAERNEPTDPIEHAEPIEPIDRNEPLHPIDRNESSDHKDHRELVVVVVTDPMAPSWRTGHSERRSSPVGVRAALRPGSAATTLASTNDTTGTVASGTA